MQAGLALVQAQLVRWTVNGQTYWLGDAVPPGSNPAPSIYLLPNFDEYGVGYSDRNPILHPTRTGPIDPARPVYFSYMIVLEGQIVGAWKRVVGKDSVVITTDLFTPFSPAEHTAFAAAAERYGAFLGRTVQLA